MYVGIQTFVFKSFKSGSLPSFAPAYASLSFFSNFLLLYIALTMARLFRGRHRNVISVCIHVLTCMATVWISLLAQGFLEVGMCPHSCSVAQLRTDDIPIPLRNRSHPATYLGKHQCFKRGEVE